jgi:hypothetical protein
MALRSPVRLVVGTLVLGTAVLVAPSSSSAPAPKWTAPTLISSRQAGREISLGISPANPKVMAACAPSGVPNTGNGQSYFHRSVDAGKTWAELRVETADTDSRKFAFEGGDCDVAFDKGGTMYSADTWLGNLSVGASKDNGKTWTGTALAVSSPIVDRPWLVGGPKGTVYLSYHDVQCCMPSLMWFTKSTDFGATFSPAVPIPTPGPEGAYIWEGNFVVSPSGRDVHLVYSRRLAPTGLDTGMDIFLASSHDGGTTWSSTQVASIPKATTSIYPSIGLDGGGHLHVAWASPAIDADDEDVPVYYTTSGTQGRSWSRPLKLTSGTFGYAPWVVGGARAGESAIAWLGSPLESDQWYFYWARTKQDSKGRPSVRAGRTTTKPLYEGAQIAPEFEMVALDKQGRLNIAMAVYRTDPDTERTGWALYFQRETAVPK